MSTFAPSLVPTYAPTLQDATPSSLVLGMGVGTFTIIVLSIALTIVWCLSMPCQLESKLAWRAMSTTVFAIVFLILLFAPRESLYGNEGAEVEIYDHSIVPRIAIALVSIFFGFVALLIVLLNAKGHMELSTTQHDLNAFWQD